MPSISLLNTIKTIGAHQNDEAQRHTSGLATEGGSVSRAEAPASACLTVQASQRLAPGPGGPPSASANYDRNANNLSADANQ